MRIVAGLVLGAFAAVGARGQSVIPLQKLDLKKFTGTWYEVALLPDKKQKTCVADAVVLFSEKNKPRQFELVNSCLMKNGFSNVRNGDGKQDKQEDGKLKVIYLWPFSVKHWVLAADPDYQWALVGTPNHKNLYVLTKDKTPSDALMAELKAKASAQGFDVGKLIMMPQKRPPTMTTGENSGTSAKP